MILSSETKLCVTLVLILALLAVLNMNSAKPIANVGAVTRSSSSSVISNFTTNTTSKNTKKSSKPTTTKTVSTSTASKTTASKTTASKTATTTTSVPKKAPAKKAAAKKPVQKAAKAVPKKSAVKKAEKKVAKVIKKAKKDTKKKQFKASDYLPKEVNKKWWNTDFSVAKNKVDNKNLIPTQNYVTGINTVSSSLRLANHDLRARPANPQIVVSPWLNTTVAPDHNTKPLGI